MVSSDLKRIIQNGLIIRRIGSAHKLMTLCRDVVMPGQLQRHRSRSAAWAKEQESAVRRQSEVPPLRV
jgi:hypothetical protein